MELEALQMKRVAAYAINYLIKHYKLGNAAEKFNGDDERWIVDVPVTAKALIRDRLVAVVEFGDTWVRVFIPKAVDILRRAHVRETDLRAHGITEKTMEDVLGNVEDDIVAKLNIDLREIPGLDSPRRKIPTTTMRRKFKIKGTLYDR